MVAGGQINTFQQTNRVEIYDIVSDTWSELPPLNQAKCSVSLSFKGLHLYAIGGLCRTQTSIQFSNTIEKLNLNELQSGWRVLNVKLQQTGLDFGTFSKRSPQNGEEDILIFGGWN